MEILVDSVSKSFGKNDVLHDLSFRVQSGKVTLLAGPNGAGKSTILRIMCGLDSADRGRVLLDGRPYSDLENPAFRVGALLDASWLDPQLTAAENLEILARLGGIDGSRVNESLGRCGLSSVANRRVSSFSLGMRQRCGIAAALLGEPQTLILDEPVNGLDPAGMRWLHGLIRDHVAGGGTALVSSHFLADSQSYADNIVIIGRGEVLWEGSLDSLTEHRERCQFRSADDAVILADLGIADAGSDGKGVVSINVPPEAVSAASRRTGIDLYYLDAANETLSDAYERISRTKVEFQ